MPRATRRKADLNKVNWFMAELILVIMVIYVTMVYGPIAAFLVELFPTVSATPPCPCRITSATAGSAACCRCRDRRGGRDRQHLRRPVVPDRGGADDGGRGRALLRETKGVNIVDELRRGDPEDLSRA